jgi:hypothetical protein
MEQKGCQSLFFDVYRFGHLIKTVISMQVLNQYLIYVLFTGSFIFLAIEGGASQMQQRTLASTNRQLKPSQHAPNKVLDTNITISQSAIQDTIEARQKTVENIWEITVSLNILYRENWTR